MKKAASFLFPILFFISILCGCLLLERKGKLENELVSRNLAVAELNRNITQKNTEILRLKTQLMALMNGLDMIADSNEKIKFTLFKMGGETISICAGKNWNEYFIDRSGKLHIYEHYSCGSDCIESRESKTLPRPIKQHLLDYLLIK